MGEEGAKGPHTHTHTHTTRTHTTRSHTAELSEKGGLSEEETKGERGKRKIWRKV